MLNIDSSEAKIKSRKSLEISSPQPLIVSVPSPEGFHCLSSHEMIM